MGLWFDSRSNNYLTFLGTFAQIVQPFSISCWFKATSTVAGYICGQTASTSGNSNGQLLGLSTVTAGTVSAVSGSAGTLVEAASTTIFNTGVWNHACAVFNSNTDRRAYLNGPASEGTNASSNNPAAVDSISVGVFRKTSLLSLFDGALAELVIYNFALSKQQIAALANGADPVLVSGAKGIIGYWPLNNPMTKQLNVVGKGFDFSGANLVLSGTSPRLTEHPPQLRYVPQNYDDFLNNVVSTPRDNLRFFLPPPFTAAADQPYRNDASSALIRQSWEPPGPLPKTLGPVVAISLPTGDQPTPLRRDQLMAEIRQIWEPPPPTFIIQWVSVQTPFGDSFPYRNDVLDYQLRLSWETDPPRQPAQRFFTQGIPSQPYRNDALSQLLLKTWEPVSQPLQQYPKVVQSQIFMPYRQDAMATRGFWEPAFLPIQRLVSFTQAFQQPYRRDAMVTRWSWEPAAPSLLTQLVGIFPSSGDQPPRTRLNMQLFQSWEPIAPPLQQYARSIQVVTQPYRKDMLVTRWSWEEVPQYPIRLKTSVFPGGDQPPKTRLNMRLIQSWEPVPPPLFFTVYSVQGGFAPVPVPPSPYRPRRPDEDCVDRPKDDEPPCSFRRRK